LASVWAVCNALSVKIEQKPNKGIDGRTLSEAVKGGGTSDTAHRIENITSLYGSRHGTAAFA